MHAHGFVIVSVDVLSRAIAVHAHEGAQMGQSMYCNECHKHGYVSFERRAFECHIVAGDGAGR